MRTSGKHFRAYPTHVPWRAEKSINLANKIRTKSMYDAPKRRLYYCSRRLCQSSLPKAAWEVETCKVSKGGPKGVQRTLLNRLQTHQKRSKKNPEDACNLSKTPPRRCQEQPGKRTPGKSEFSCYAPPSKSAKGTQKASREPSQGSSRRAKTLRTQHREVTRK